MRSGTPYTDMEDALIKRYTREGKSDQMIAILLGRSWKSVAERRRRLNMAPQPREKKMPNASKKNNTPERVALRARVKAALLSGKSQEQIKAELMSEGFTSWKARDTVDRQAAVIALEAERDARKNFKPRDIGGMVELSPGHIADARSAEIIMSVRRER